MRNTLTSLIYRLISSKDVLELRIVGTDAFEWYKWQQKPPFEQKTLSHNCQMRIKISAEVRNSKSK